LVIEEHNFDPWCFPTSLNDICENKAFRGDDQTVRFGIAFGAIGGLQWYIGR